MNRKIKMILAAAGMTAVLSACGVSAPDLSGTGADIAAPAKTSSVPMDSPVARTGDTAQRAAEETIQSVEKTLAELDAAKNAPTQKKYDVPSSGDLYIPVSFSISSTQAVQGEILAVHADMNSETEIPRISTELGDTIFLPDGEGRCTAYVPVWYAQTPGTYPLHVHAASGKSVDFDITVLPREFGEQHMTISQDTVDATRGADNANEDYAEKIKSLYPTADETKYWSEPFLQPVEARVSTEFGLYRYTNGSATPTRHSGIDLAAAAGTPVPAANTGRVVFAGEVIITGNTVVIEHGGGLKTYYFHMSEVSVEKDQMVERGEIIGKVGSTGYSTGAHLHFEVKIGSFSLNPWTLFDGTSGIYR